MKVDNIQKNEHYNLNLMGISIIFVCTLNVYQVEQFYILSGITVCIFYNKIEIKRDGGTYFIEIWSYYPNLTENTMSLF